MNARFTITADPVEQLFYQIAAASDDIALTVASLKIASVAREGSKEYMELVCAAASRRMQLENERKLQRN